MPPSVPAQTPAVWRPILALWRALASLRLAVVLLAALIAVLIYATIVESRDGTAAAQFGIYGAWWFLTLNALLAANVAASALIRLPWKRRQTGFVVVHTGILVLLAGCWLSYAAGSNGHLAVFEGSTSRRMIEEGFRFQLDEKPADNASPPNETPRKAEPLLVDFQPGPFSYRDYASRFWFPWALAPRDRGVLYDRDGIRLDMLDYLSDSRREAAPRLTLWAASAASRGPADHVQPLVLAVTPAEGMSSHALRREGGIGQRVATAWGPRVIFSLAASEAETEAFQHTAPAGPLGPFGQIVLFHQGQTYRFSVEALRQHARQPLGESGFEIELVEFDPASLGVQLAVHGGEGSQPMSLFATLPHFNRYDARDGVYGSYWFDPQAATKKPTQASAAAAADSPGENEAANTEATPGETPAAETTASATAASESTAAPAAPAQADVDRAGPISPEALADASFPRVEILLGQDERLYYRTASPAVVTPAAPWPKANGSLIDSTIDVFPGQPFALRLAIDSFAPRRTPGWVIVPQVSAGPSKSRQDDAAEPRAQIRVTVDGAAEEFWIAGPSMTPAEDQEHTVQGGPRADGTRRTVVVSMPARGEDLGFEVALRQFERRLDPGSGMPSHYASVVDVLAADDPARVLKDNATIKLNQPLDVTDPVSRRNYRLLQESFEGPWGPSDPRFRQIVGSRSDRRELYRSVLRVNYDPGRGLKYLGGLLIIVGIGIVYYMRAYFFRSKTSPNESSGGGAAAALRSLALAALLVVGANAAHAADAAATAPPSEAATVASAENTTAAATVARESAAREPAGLDWDAWQRLPVHFGGRTMPLDTFARTMVEAICGRENPTLAPPASDDPAAASARALFPDGQPRRFQAAELLYSWLVEPQRWRGVPFLNAEHKDLREGVLALPLVDANGRRLRFATLDTVETNPGLHRSYMQWQQRQAADPEAEPSAVDRKVLELIESYDRFRGLTDEPGADGQAPRRFLADLTKALQGWARVTDELRTAGRLTEDDAAGRLALAMREPFGKVAMSAQGASFDRATIEPALAELEKTAALLAAQLQSDAAASSAARPAGAPTNEPAGKASDTPAAAGATDDAIDAQSDGFAQAVRLDETARAVVNDLHQAHLALFDGPLSLRLVPALDPAALDARRVPESDLQPWLGWRALLEGSDALLRGYPADKLAAVRQAWAEARAAYLDRGRADRPAAFAAAMQEFSAALRALGDAATAGREQLPIRNRDEDILKATAYPPPHSTDMEVAYNRLNPFLWSWVIGLAAVVSLALAFGVVRQPLFWLGLLLLAVAQAMTVAGFVLRWKITGWVPVTGMFETIAFAGLCVAILGVVFALAPMLLPGVADAWALCGAPFRQTADRRRAPVEAQWGLVALRALSAVLVAIVAAQYITLWPKTASGAAGPDANAILVALTGAGVVAAAAYLLPRAALTLVLSLWSVPSRWRREGFTAAVAQVLRRRVFALTGAAVGVLVALVAYFAPAGMLHREIGLPMPILRDNFWLTVHVLTITFSYGAGALAWGLGNIALGYYLFGRYRTATAGAIDPDIDGAEGNAQAATAAPLVQPRRLPPAGCHALAQYTYRATQAAVLLLAAGTIFGALWADISWGRFWSWDAKETWSLLTLLAYMLILHGRHVGWFGDFGLAIGSVLGFTFIVMAWYGVNYVLPVGLHSYGQGAGGQSQVAIAVLVNWCFVVAAGVRYSMETDSGRAPAS